MNKKRHVIFWIKSGRGTDNIACFEVPLNITKDSLKCYLEDWCKNFGCWESSENFVTYGYKDIKRPPRQNQVLKMYDKACKSKNKAAQNWKKWAAILYPSKLKV